MRSRSGQLVICWLCDYSLVFLGLTMVMSVALIRWLNRDTYETSPVPIAATIEMPNPPVQITPTLLSPLDQGTSLGTPVLTPSPFDAFLTLESTFLPQEKPEFVFVFVPVVWSGGMDEFKSHAYEQAEYFINASDMDEYFQIRIEILDENLSGVALSDDELVYKIVNFGLDRVPGNRYIGITDGDISMDGSSDVSGWTYGSDSLGLVAESSGLEIASHELGHTFGLCDEYNYSYWLEQNEMFLNGCPNPYPSNCVREVTVEVICEGNPAPSGANSMMGPSGLHGPYEFNRESYLHLQYFFEMYSRE